MALEWISDNLKTKGEQVGTVARSGLWVGRTFSQYLVKPFTHNICPICNNFEARGHPMSSDKTRGFAEDSESSPSKRSALYDGRVWLEIDHDLKSMTDRAISSRPCEYCKALVGIIKFLVPEWLTPNDTSRMSIIDFSFLEGACPRVGLRSSSTDFRLSFEFFRDIDSPSRAWSKLPSLPRGRDRSTRSNERSVWQFIRQCFLTCMKEHEKCEKTSLLPIPRDLPKRLVFVGEENDEIRLCETSGTGIAQYAALSYSWGGRKAIQTSKSNIEQLKQTISWTELGAVFQDAVTSTRYMNLKYVWIDALCIVQDDKDDWEDQAARMGDVYANAFITFIAASSPNVETPFLGPRTRQWRSNTASLKEPDGTDSCVRFRRLATPNAMLKNGPSKARYMESASWLAGSVYRRGWCYQEALVSPRNVHFTDGSIVWECRTVRRAEDDIPPYTSTVPVYGPTSIVKFDHNWLQVSWLNAVSSYTRRELTYDSDTLPAISGIAAQFSCSDRGRYVAGLWESFLLHDLTWNRNSEDPCHIPEKYVAPSWSWASIRCCAIWNLWDIRETYASIVSVSTTLAGRNQYGEVTDGEVVINAPLISVTIKHNTENKLCLKFKEEVKDVRVNIDCPIHAATGWCTDGTPESTSRRSLSTDPPSYWTRDQLKAMQEDKLKAYVLPVLYARGFGVVSLLLGRSTFSPGVMVRLGVCFSIPEAWIEKQDIVVTKIT